MNLQCLGIFHMSDIVSWYCMCGRPYNLRITTLMKCYYTTHFTDVETEERRN